MPGPDIRDRLLLRLLLSFTLAAVVFGISFICSWRNYSNFHERPEQRGTRRMLDVLRQDLERQREAGKLPETLDDLPAVKEKKVRVDEKGRPVDSWGWPLHYQRTKDGFMLFSTGRDGKVGGSDMDTDLFAGEPDPATVPLTLEEFLSKPDAFGMIAASILAGLVTFPVLFLQLKPEVQNRPSLVKVLLANVVTAFFAVLAALMMGAIHVMKGH